MEVYGKPLYTAFDDVYAKKEDLERIQKQLDEHSKQYIMLINWLLKHANDNHEMKRTLNQYRSALFTICASSLIIVIYAFYAVFIGW